MKKWIGIGIVAAAASFGTAFPVSTALASCSGPRPDATYTCKCYTFTINKSRRERICSWTKTRR